MCGTAFRNRFGVSKQTPHIRSTQPCSNRPSLNSCSSAHPPDLSSKHVALAKRKTRNKEKDQLARACTDVPHQKLHQITKILAKSEKKLEKKKTQQTMKVKPLHARHARPTKATTRYPALSRTSKINHLSRKVFAVHFAGRSTNQPVQGADVQCSAPQTKKVRLALDSKSESRAKRTSEDNQHQTLTCLLHSCKQLN